ncbi:hypothetical protein S40285_10499 [Stachybotrys chlorohalonatus IBT 40285]|uniref:Uncharacterized protein n=1 Tax=Stachybotrys chlorohalonatus (strain IBT 40285) TaxID=1283841 RepID=A0A084Q8K8_STAC4|nr:hypothetical protein S40285_10499 [Stachybotrys chlorohalonata IBT 40285]
MPYPMAAPPAPYRAVDAQRLLQTYRPPVLTPLSAPDQNFMYLGMLKTPSRPLAATSISAQSPRQVFIRQCSNAPPTIIVLETRADLSISRGKPGIPRACLPPSNTYALSVYMRLLWAAQEAATRGTPLDLVSAHQFVDFQYATVGHELLADHDCRIGESDEGVVFYSAVGESIEAFFARKIRGARVVRLQPEAVGIWVNENVPAMTDMMDVDYARPAPRMVPVSPRCDVRVSRKRGLQDAEERCYKMARYLTAH